MNNHSKYVQTSGQSDWSSMVAAFGGIIIVCLIVIWSLSSASIEMEKCITAGEWIVEDRRTARVPIEGTDEYQVMWDWVLVCDCNRKTRLTYQSPHPTLFEMYQRVTWTPE